jgi:predicted dehydrogenase
MRIGLIGAGAVAGYHATAAGRLDDAAMTAVCDLDADAAQRIAGPIGAATFADYRELYASGLIDAVIVNTPHALHLPMVLDAAAQGLHVLVEKPMATTIAGCDEMIAACENAGVALVVGHIQHFLPDKRAVEGILASGELGSPQFVRDYRSTDYRPGTRAPWFFSESMAGGGALMNIGGHCLDRSLWLGGAPAASIRAQLSRRFGSPVETDGSMQLELADGVGVSICVVSDTPERTDELMIVCEDGVIVADPRRGTRIRRNGVTRTVSRPKPSDIEQAFGAQLADFAAAVRGAQPRVSLQHARHVVELVLAAYESAERGETVLLDTKAALPGVCSAQ